MTEKIAHLVAKRPWPFIALFVLLSVGFATQLSRIQVDAEVKNQLPKDFPARVDMDRIEALFGGTELLMLTLTADDVLAQKTLSRVKALSDKLVKHESVDRVLSLFELKDIKNVGEAMVVDPAVKTIPTSATGRAKLREELKKNDLVYGMVVSKDFKATTVVALLSVGTDDEPLLADVKKIIGETPGPEEVHIAGMPLVRFEVGKNITTDIRRFLPMGLLVMLIFLFVFFRQLRGVLLPFAVVLMTIPVTIGLIPLFGWKIQMLTVVLPVILLAIANDYGIHLVARYQEMNTPGNTLDKRTLASDVFSELVKPIAIAGLTTIAGMLCLMAHIIVPAREMGVLAALGILYAVLASLFFIPALLAVLPKAKPMATAAAGEGKLTLLDRALAAGAPAVCGRPKTVIAASLVLTIGVGIGVARLNIDTNTINYFPDDHPVAEAAKIADEHFGGSITFSVGIKGDIKHPDVLRRLDDLREKIEALPQVDETTSIAKVIREMNKVMNGDDPAYDRIPDTREGVAQLLLMYENSGDPDDFDRLVDFGYQNAQLTARINTPSTGAQAAVINLVRRYVADANAGRLPLPPRKPLPPKKKAPASAPASAPADSPFTLVEGDKKGAKKEKAPKENDSPFTLVDTGVKKKGEKKVVKSTASAAPTPAEKPRFTMVGGFAVLFTDLVDGVVRGQLRSLGISLLLVVLIVALLFRSFVAGLLSGLTLALAMLFLFGLMGLVGIELNIPTAMLSSIMIGVGVDYTIHFLWRFRKERRDGKEPVEAAVRTLTTTGRGIVINALSVVIGFSVMFVSTFTPVRYFGFLVGVSITACLLGAMVLMPALVLLINPRFLNPSKEA